ncbi:MAG TPA: hypothetical protein VMA77_14720 [Solirubrobacteraceae bacterium]|nr:hypothetical protein [Solirubrobacteraceae bacterium]
MVVETVMPTLCSSARAVDESRFRPALDAAQAPDSGITEKVVPELTLTIVPAP